VRLFGLRLDKIEKAGELNMTETQSSEIRKLQKQIADLPQNSIVIKDARFEMQRLEEPDFWNALTIDKVEFLRAIVKPLFRTVSETDFAAMRFEKDIVEVSLAWMTNDNSPHPPLNPIDDVVLGKYETLKNYIIETIGRLPLTLNVVSWHNELIKQSQTEHYWSTISEAKFDELIENLAPLMKYIELVMPLGPAKFNLKDILTTKEYIEFGPQHEALSVGRYRELVEQKIQELTNSNPLLQKLKHGESLSDIEAEQLAEQLHNEHPHITLDLLRRIYDNRKAQFTQFIKHILGLEVLKTYTETVTSSFDAFIAEHSYLSSRQLQFLELLRTFVFEKGELKKRDLIYAPFTSIHPEGIRGVFNPKEIDEILILAQQLNAA
jgi:type I restriction enzyme R subunit